MSAKKTKSAVRPARKKTDALALGDPLGETAARLALLAKPVAAPSSLVKAQLLDRIRQPQAKAGTTNAPAGWYFESAAAAEGWRGGRFPGVRFKTLSVDEVRDVVMVLVDMAPGSRFPDHPHDLGGDEGIVISGDVINAGQLMRAGDYYRADEGTIHTNTVSPSGCLALVSLTARAWKKWREHVLTP